MGPGLAAPAKKASAEGRGGSVMVGRGGGAAPASAFGADMVVVGNNNGRKIQKKINK